jgi:signal transduction histidine kinase
LLNNAVKFVAPHVTPVVCISSECSANRVRLWVADNGIGINPNYQNRLFGMFERIHPDLKYEGNGVGLAIVRKTVERMGGKVGVESDGVNGSRFWIELAAADQK